MAFLRERWAQVQEGLGQVVLINGEPGIGKSRLVQVLKDQFAGERYTRIEYRCASHHQHSALYPVITIWSGPWPLPAMIPRTTSSASWSRLAAPPLAPPRHRAALCGPVAAAAARDAIPLTLTPQRQRQKTLEALLAWLWREATRQPVLFIVEDLHWIDPSTLELLTLLMAQGPTARLLTVLTCRPEFHPPWPLAHTCTLLTLSRLAHPQAAQMIARMTGDRTLPAEVLQQIVAKTDGVPLFVEELTKTVLESGLLREHEDRYEPTGPLPPLAIPATLHDSLMARLDRLAPVKAVAQLGAVLGRTFAYELLQAVTPLNEASLQQALAQLVDAELLYQRGLPPQATYMFKHALIQDAAYESLLRSTRQQYHQRIAQVFETRFPETVETHRSCSPSITPRRAAPSRPWVTGSGRRARHGARRMWKRSATSPRGWSCSTPFQRRPSGPSTQLDFAHRPRRGPANGERTGSSRSGTRLRAGLCVHTWANAPVFPGPVWPVAVLYCPRGVAHGTRAGDTVLRLAQRTPDPTLAVIARYALGATWLGPGALPAARAHQEEGIARYTPDQRRAPAFRIGHDLGVGCRVGGGVTLWLLGYPDQALPCRHEGLTLAHELSHPFSLAFARCYAAMASQLRRDVLAVYEHAEAAVTLATEQGFPYWTAMGTSLRGWALAMQGQGEEGLAQVRQGDAAWRATGAALHVPYFCTLLAEVYIPLGSS